MNRMAAEKEQKKKDLPPLFQSRKNITIGKAMKLFANGKNIKPVPAEEHPYFILLVGSPGVGKSKKAEKFIEDEKGEIHKKYDDFYHISLDTIVEHIQPYREATKKAYNLIKNTRKRLNPNGKNLTPNNLSPENLSILAKFYPIVQSTSNDFGLTPKKMKTIKNNIQKLYSINIGNVNNTKQKNINQLTNKFKQISFTEEKTPEEKTPENDPLLQASERLFKASEAGLRYAIQHRYNLIYDTTLDGTPKRLIEALRLLEQFHRPHSQKYKIFVIHVSASAENIKGRINTRHNEMLSNKLSPYIRAIKKMMVNGFIKNTEIGIESSKEWLAYNSALKSNNPQKVLSVYTPDDIKFIPIHNPTIKNK